MTTTTVARNPVYDHLMQSQATLEAERAALAARLGAMDEVANNVFLLGGGLGLSVFVGWRMADPMSVVREGAERVTWFGLWRVFLRFAAPVFLGFVLVQAVPGTVRTLLGLFG